MLRALLKRIYFSLPFFIRENSLVEVLRSFVKKSLKKEDGLQNINYIDKKVISLSNEDLDNFVGYALNCVGETSGKFFEYITSIKCDYDYKQHPIDPASQEYYEYQKNLYKKVSGKDYDVSFEKSDVVVSEVLREPYKYLEFNQKRVSRELEAISLLIRELDLNTGSIILECGGGRGHITEQLCLLGLDVTAIEIDKKFCKIVEKRLSSYKKSFKLLNTDFDSGVNDFEKDTLDAVLFHNCFHHSYNHRKLVKNISSKLKKGCSIFFLNEPVYPDFPIPWGLRLDGESLFQIRRNGWYELGFNQVYFRAMLESNGFEVIEYRQGESCLIKAILR